MYIHLNGFNFDFSKQVISSFITSKDYQRLPPDIAGIHLADTYQQMIHAGVNKDELIKAMLNYHISALQEDGVSVDAIKKSNYQDVNVSFLIDMKSDSFARFLNFNDTVKEDTVTIGFRNFNDSIELSYSDLLQLEEPARDFTMKQLLLSFLSTFKTTMDSDNRIHRQRLYATLASTGLLLFASQINILDAMQYHEIEFELQTEKLLLNLPAGLDTCLFKLTFNS